MKGKYLAPSPRKRRHGSAWLIPIAALVIAAAGLAVFCLGQERAEQPEGEAMEFAELADTEPAAASGTLPAPSAPENNGATVPQTNPPQEATDPGGEEIAPGGAAAGQAQAILDGMTLEEKIYQLFIVTPEQLTGFSAVTQAGETTQTALEQYPVGGIVYFAANLTSRDQCATMIRNTQSYSKLGLFIAVDEEGGSVARLGSNSAMGTTSFPAMGVIGQTGDPTQAYHVGYTIGTEIGELGFNLDFAPVADVNSNPNNPVIGTRAFHSDPEIAAEMVAACVQGFNDSQMLSTLKHFPGHGDTEADSHYGEAETEKTLQELMECEMLPFEAGIQAGAPFVMVGHITTPNVTQDALPASLSYEIVTGLLRNTLGFQGLVVTDSMSMQAIVNQYSAGEAAVKALQAGVDIILMPSSLSGAVSGIKEAIAAGELSEARINESVLRILETKIRSGIIAAE